MTSKWPQTYSSSIQKRLGWYCIFSREVDFRWGFETFKRLKKKTRYKSCIDCVKILEPRPPIYCRRESFHMVQELFPLTAPRSDLGYSVKHLTWQQVLQFWNCSALQNCNVSLCVRRSDLRSEMNGCQFLVIFTDRGSFLDSAIISDRWSLVCQTLYHTTRNLQGRIRKWRKWKTHFWRKYPQISKIAVWGVLVQNIQ